MLHLVLMDILRPLGKFAVLLCLLHGVLANRNPSYLSLSPEDVITRDVVVIGGGAAGTYAAVRLQDFNKSVVIVEKKGNLGGHAQVYYDPSNHYPITLGVVIFENASIVHNYLDRFHVPISAPGPNYLPPTYVDFRTGRHVNVPEPSDAELAAAFEKYSAQLEKVIYT